jgi:hypothetical protein
MSWREYEEKVAHFFTARGWTIQHQTTVQGVRTNHQIDVMALTDRLGVTVRWLIECKDWDSKVPKEKVLALRSVVDDTGADRGIILNEAGFQRGAFEAAHSANVTVTTLADLEQAMEARFREVRLEAAHRTLADLTVRTHKLMVVVERTRASGSLRMRKGVRDSAGYTSRLGVVGTAETGVARARAGQLPVPMPDLMLEEIEQIETIGDVLERADLVIEWIEGWLQNQEAGVDKAGGWDEP